MPGRARPVSRLADGFSEFLDRNATSVTNSGLAHGVSPVNRSGWFYSPDCPDEGGEGTIGSMAGRKRHSAEDIVHKVRRAADLAEDGTNSRQTAADPEVSAARLAEQ